MKTDTCLQMTCAFVLGALLLCGCSSLKEKVTETAKVMWGSSTKALEDKRSQAASKTFACSLEECRSQIDAIIQEESLKVFIDNPQKGLLVIMGLPEIIETTEVGIFMSSPGAAKTTVDIVSLSPHAQTVSADLFFPKLQKSFPEAP